MGSLPEDTSPSPSQKLRAQLERDGFVILRGLLDPSGPELPALRAAAARATARARAGKWPHVRTVGKQFPPWDDAALARERGIWGVQHVLHPNILPDDDSENENDDDDGGGGRRKGDRAAFIRAYFSDALLTPAKALIGSASGEDKDKDKPCTDDDLVMELCNLLVRPSSSFSLRWHRDDIPPSASPAEELARLREPAFHAQWNLALSEGVDGSLVVVPGSHRRARTPAERAADPLAGQISPDQIAVSLRGGDAVFYDNNILHRGVYDSNKERLTLHGSVGHVAGSRVRARNVLQHGVGEWVGRADFSCLGDEEEPVRRRAEGMRERLVRLGAESGSDVGYSLQG